MKELFQNPEWWLSFIQAVWTIFLVPIFSWAGKELHAWAKTKKLEKYTDMLYIAVRNVVKDMYQTVVGELKGTSEWTPEKQNEIREIAKTKIIGSITSDGYKFLKAVNSDFEDWLESLIESAIYDEKRLNSN